MGWSGCDTRRESRVPGVQGLLQNGIRHLHRKGKKLLNGEPVPAFAPTGELPGAESAGGFQRQSPVFGAHQQARQFDDAVVAGGSRTDGGTARSGAGPRIQTIKVSAWCQRGESRHRTAPGGEDVLDSPPGPRGGTRRFARQVARRTPWWSAGPAPSGRLHRRFEWAPGLPARGGEFGNKNHGPGLSPTE